MTLDDTTISPALHASACSNSMPDWACTWLHLAGAALASPFTLALLGSLAGAFAGAVAAVRMVERRKLREDLVKEIHNTNAAIMVGLAICNKALQLKKLHVLPLKEKYVADHAAYAEFVRQRRTGERQGNALPPTVVDTRTVVTLTFPTTTLQSLMFGKISITGRALALMTTLGDTASGLIAANAQRNELVERLRRLAPNAAELPPQYLGVPSTSGQVNRAYPDAVATVAARADEMIFFSAALCDDLLAHGRQLRASFVERFGKKDAPPLNGVDFSTERAAGLMPPEADYAEWMSGLAARVTAEPAA